VNYLGRFISADTIIASLANPQSLNRYSYVYNNPINNTDPTGHRPCDGEYGCSADPQQRSKPTKPITNKPQGGGNRPANRATRAEHTGRDDKGSGSPESPNRIGGGYSDPSNDRVNSVADAIPKLIALDEASRETEGHCGACKYPIPWNKLSKIQRDTLMLRGEWEGSWNDNSGAVDVGGTLEDPFTYITIGGGVKIAYSLGIAVVARLTARTVIIIERVVEQSNITVEGDVVLRDKIIQNIQNNIYGPFTPEQWKDIKDWWGK
jgi:hypothetical protein